MMDKCEWQAPFACVETEMERFKVGLQTAIPQGVLQDLDIDVYTDYLGGCIVAGVRGFVWAEKESAQHYEDRWPTDWWQAFKERWFPDWALARWPVQYKAIVVDVKALYPHFAPAIPNEPYVLHIVSKETMC